MRTLLVLTLALMPCALSAADEATPAPVQILERVPQLPPADDPWWCSPDAAWTARYQFERDAGTLASCSERQKAKAHAEAQATEVKDR